MSASAAAACAAAEVPLLRLARPGWADHPLAGGWQWVDGPAEAADPHVADRQCRVAHPAGQRRGHRDPGTVQFSGQRPCLGGPTEDQHGIHPVTVAAGTGRARRPDPAPV